MSAERLALVTGTSTGIGAAVARELLERAVELGHDKEYWPVLLRAIEDGTTKK